ncbi:MULTISPECIES: inositol monophosphatase family protein [unclassified Oceanobacter]|uniref:inositol monophosphatase family protein n=1 Tax=unclassified Oceanobacter TaxID=2620260 RepID=UPI0026E1AF90|nr:MULTISPECIES: inositol monophosphatase family protein [unclassified Oceanobacter]MDO6682565.1 inositol monophosphatase family protein [Oceanobacter sp. 5_MG-2023]MDP2506781.1 inositol monophosphatase family protein [Oceanobacter sp. 3_MG-2023]MDP2547910.1 inositol monophosphatase family protein [Oceanobacter sp. 4_MG-2023]MDP2608798.1 inositol monophosphatase family protein [Oceanobacter sp. 1_MG-2023]
MVNLALRAARNAGQDLVRRLDRFDSYQSTDQEKAKFIADCTIGLEKSIIFELKKSYPEHSYNGRETGVNSGVEKQPIWQICVIDDIANFRVGIPAFAIIVGCQINGKTEHAVVTNPINGDEFTASRGRGAQLSGRRIRCGQINNLSDAIVGYTQPVGVGEDAYVQRERIMKLMGKTYELRNIGSNALSIAYVAADRFQAAALSNVDEFSLLAGGLIASEAGCLISDIHGEPRVRQGGNLLVSNPRLLKSLMFKD